MKRIELQAIVTLTPEQLEFIDQQRDRLFYAQMGESMREYNEIHNNVMEQLRTIFPTLLYFIPDFLRGGTTLVFNEEEN